MSFVSDERYDPCRNFSKLGVSIDHIRSLLDSDSNELTQISGVHLHTNCESENPDELKQTVERVEATLGSWLAQLDWINLGGGYDYGQDSQILESLVRKLGQEYGLAVYVEPGASVSRPHGYIVASVVDVFTTDGKQMAVLDTSINHMPEVFEYQYEPDVVDDYYGGRYEYLLAGGTCLAGDVFGLYGFDTQLEVGSRLVFTDMGAYSLVKAHTFNGVGLPDVYAWSIDSQLELKSKFTYDDFVRRCGG